MAAGLQQEKLLQDMFDAFDIDQTGFLDYEQFCKFFGVMNSDVSLDRSEWEDMCQDLNVDPARGIARGLQGFDQFFEASSTTAVRSLHTKIMASQSTVQDGKCVVCGRTIVECLCAQLREELCGAHCTFGEHKGRPLIDLYMGKPEYVKWLVRECKPAPGSRVPMDRFLLKVAACQHYLDTYEVVREPEPEKQARRTPGGRAQALRPVFLPWY